MSDQPPSVLAGPEQPTVVAAVASWNKRPAPSADVAKLVAERDAARDPSPDAVALVREAAERAAEKLDESYCLARGRGAATRIIADAIAPLAAALVAARERGNRLASDLADERFRLEEMRARRDGLRAQLDAALARVARLEAAVNAVYAVVGRDGTACQCQGESCSWCDVRKALSRAVT